MKLLKSNTIKHFGLAALLIWGANLRAAPVQVKLAADGKAFHKVITAAHADNLVKELAVDLTNLLQRITGATFEIEESDSSAEGIVLAARGDFDDLPADMIFTSDKPQRREEYRIRTHSKGIWLAGATPQAVSHAVWGLLDSLGYRLFFPTDTWEVVPEIRELSLALDLFETPDFHTRDAPRGAPWTNRQLWQRWLQRNRITSAFKVSTGHVYDRIINRNRAAFTEHPEFYGLVNGERTSSKMCISNPRLRQLVIDFAVNTIKAKPQLDSVSMDPSDGSGWCECDDCVKMGSISDRALLLANIVAEAINGLGLGDKYVGMYAYNQHSPPPTIDVHPKVVVSVATSFIRGGFKLNELIEGWRDRKAILGIRDYHDVFPWSHDMPRRAVGGDLLYLAEKIPYFYQQGARYMNSENGDSWGANGLGYWITPRLLWRVSEADRVDTLVEDFIGKAFGKAAAPMREFYNLISRDKSLRTAEDLVARMYRNLETARTLASDQPLVMARLDDLVLYTRYCELYNLYRQSSGEERQAAFEQVWRHAYRMRDRLMLSTVSICHRDKFRDRSVTVPEEAGWLVPEEDNPWKSSEPWQTAEIANILQNGIAANQPVVLDFEPKQYSEKLIPATKLIPEGEFAAGTLPLRGRGLRKFHLWFEKPSTLASDITGGQITHYRDRGNVKLNLFAEEEATLEAVARDDSVPPDGETYRVSLTSPYSGMHTLELADGGDMTTLTLPEDIPITVPSSLTSKANLGGRWTLYCYVPKGTKVLGGHSSGTTGLLRDSSGETQFDFTELNAASYFSVPVPEGQDGTFWRFERCSGERSLMTIPPYLASHPSKLLLPVEVVEADSVTDEPQK